MIQIYGLTETAPLLTINRSRSEWDDLSPAERASKLSRAGVPAVGIDLRVDGQGEVLARGNHILKSYWDQPEATADALDGGWFHTGDGGDLDDGGYLTISDRKKDVIISGGENVSSIEVEDALFSHPAVAEVAVIGVPDEKWGETVKGLVVLAPGADGRPRTSCGRGARSAWPATSARRRSRSATSWPARPPASSRSSSSAPPTGRAGAPGQLMRVSVGDCRLFIDVEGLGLVPEGPTMRARPTMLVLHGGPGFDHSSFKPDFGALADVAQLVYVDHRRPGPKRPQHTGALDVRPVGGRPRRALRCPRDRRSRGVRRLLRRDGRHALRRSGTRATPAR